MSFRFQNALSEKETLLLNALQLAYLGDSVWEVLVREELIHRGLNVHHMHTACVGFVSASAQASILDRIVNDLNDEEREVVRRGRNAHSRHPVPRHQSHEDYSAATGFEALIGFLYLTGQTVRLENLANIILGEH